MANASSSATIRNASALLAVLAVSLTFGCSEPEPWAGPSPLAPLALSCPASVTAQAAAGQTAAAVTYSTPVPSGGVIPIQTQCTPRSGSSFPVGSTQVQCTATDGLAAAATCAFTVMVEPPPVPPRLSATSFLAFGDSLTEGKTALALAPWTLALSTAYTIKLQSMLQQRYSQQTIAVANEGLGGEHVSEPATVRRFDQVLDQGRPAVVLLMDGANDLLSRSQAAIPDIIGALDVLIAHARARGVQIFLASLPPQDANGIRGWNAPVVPGLNAQIRVLALSRNVTFVDVYGAFKGDLSLVGPDGLHLTDAGYEVVARAFYDRIVALLETPPAVSPR